MLLDNLGKDLEYPRSAGNENGIQEVGVRLPLAPPIKSNSYRSHGLLSHCLAITVDSGHEVPFPLSSACADAMWPFLPAFVPLAPPKGLTVGAGRRVLKESRPHRERQN
jgi:hypothetical protein